MPQPQPLLHSDSQQHCGFFLQMQREQKKNNYPLGYDKVGNFMPHCLSRGIPVRLLWKSLSYINFFMPQNGRRQRALGEGNK